LAIVALAVVHRAASDRDPAVSAADLDLAALEESAVAKRPVRFPGVCREETETFVPEWPVKRSVTVRAFDARGRERATVLMFDGRHAYTWWNQHDASGRVIRQGWHFLDSNRSVVYTFRYDSLGRKVDELMDYEADGIADDLTMYAYDDRGRLVRKHSHVRTRRGGELTTYTYDGGRLVLQRDHDDADRPEYYVRYTHDAHGLVIEEESGWYEPHESNRPFNYILRFTYDDAGRKSTLQVIGGSAGDSSETYRYGYDAAGNQTSMERLRADGTLMERTTYHYDCWK
jgi:YD repeat-containing protein